MGIYASLRIATCPKMDLLFNNCFNDDERELESFSVEKSADSKICCPHFCKEVNVIDQLSVRHTIATKLNI